MCCLIVSSLYSTSIRLYSLIWSVRQILINFVEVRDGDAGIFGDDVIGIELIMTEGFASSALRSLPEELKHLQRQVIKLVTSGKIDQEESYPSLFLELSHEFNLMFMDILK